MPVNVYDGVHPTLVAKLKLVHGAMGLLGWPMRATEGVRTLARQKQLWNQGRTTPGRIVTNCDGVIKVSNHQPKADKLGYAVDSCFLGQDPYLEKYGAHIQIWAAFGANLEAVGLAWGGRFHGLDMPHAELILVTG
jgi:peptidoglycan L-alanyl-D-glutamate endopeptidase CwlK